MDALANELNRRYEAVDKLVANVFNEVKFDMEEFEIAYESAKVKVIEKGGLNDSQKVELIKKQNSAQEQLSNLVKVISTDPGLANNLKPQILNLEAEIKSITEQVNKLISQTPEQALFTLELTKKTFLQANSASFDYLMTI